jgi:hypothetical protein
MVPEKNHPNWASLIQGRLPCKFSNTAAALLLFRLQNEVRQDVSSDALRRAIEEMHAFFTKYERMLETEIKAIFG